MGKVNKKENRQPLYNVKYVRLERTKEELRERITRRAEQRLDAIVDEVNKLLAAGVDPNWLSRVGIEYGAILSGSLPLGEGWGGDKEKIISLILLRSLQYAKRQNTWNKKYFQV